MMQWNRPGQSPTRHRSRSRTPGRRKRHEASIELSRAAAEEDEKTHFRNPSSNYLGDEPVTVSPNSNGPRSPSGSVAKEGDETDTKKSLLGMLSTAIYGNRSQEERMGNLMRRSERLREMNTKLTDENELLRRDVNSLMRSIELKATECSGLRNKLVQLGQSGVSLSDNRKPDEKSANLQQKIAHCETRIRGLERENARLLNKTSTQENLIQAQTAGFARDLETIRSNELIETPKVSDTEVQSKWRALCFAVRQFVSKYLPEALDPPTVQRIAQQQSFSWLPEISRTLQSPLLCGIILESWVWHFLCFRMLDLHSTFWAGGIGKELSILNGHVEGHILANFGTESTNQIAALSRFHDWRARSAHLISQLQTHDKDSSAKLTADMLNSLKEILPWTNAQEAIGHDMYQEALEIVHKTADLDHIFRVSRARFLVFITRIKLPLVHPPGFRFQFDPETMERVKDIPSFGRHEAVSIVDLAVSPGILKAGNSSGSNYGSEHVLVKLQALCGLRDVLAFLDGASVKEEECDGAQQDPTIKQEDEECDVDMLCP